MAQAMKVLVTGAAGFIGFQTALEARVRKFVDRYLGYYKSV
jgi:nucleoside-diphosphate-sugar epimerase